MFFQQIFNIKGVFDFETAALDIFRFQAEHNPVYSQYLAHLKISPSEVLSFDSIPYLPIRFFKNLRVNSRPDIADDIIFTSSGTGNSGQSRHYVSDLQVYKNSFRSGFEQFFGKPEAYTLLALLPGYLERKGSSLIYMVNDLIEQSKSSLSGFFLNNYQKLDVHIQKAAAKGDKIFLIGVSFALLDFFEKYRYQLPNMIVLETGGMKGRRREMLRSELHDILASASGSHKIYSEYGMTELLSQAYSTGGEHFLPTNSLRVRIRDLYDPFAYMPNGAVGGINVADLANYNSCSFIETEDIGKLHSDGSFEVLGRYDHSDIRGCNLMAV